MVGIKGHYYNAHVNVVPMQYVIIVLSKALDLQATGYCDEVQLCMLLVL